MNAKGVERFWSKVDVQGPDDCWNWTASCYPGGYGQFCLDYIHWRAHRFSWMLMNGPIPDGIDVCHSCDNPKCVNPMHLFLCTQITNAIDMVTKGRDTRHSAKLTEDDVHKIRDSYAAGILSQNDLAIAFGVSRWTISYAVRGETWKRLPGELSAKGGRGLIHPNAKLTEDEVRKIRSSYATKRFTQDRLATVFSVSQRCIYNIVNNRTWKHLKPKEANDERT